MKWEDGRRSENVQDRRGQTARRGGMALGGGAIVMLLVGVLMGKSPGELMQMLVQQQQSGGGGQVTESHQPRSPEEDRLADFVSVVLADTEDTWNAIFRQKFGRDYEEPDLVLFTGAVESACGFTSAAVGPFYCPGDRQVYIDLAFFGELDRRFGAPGDFAQAYVVAHEVGHHLQTLLGISQQVHQQRRRVSEVEGNALSVRQELQADCFAGVWAHHADRTRHILEAGDVEEGMRAATAIGDDTIQRRSRGRVSPESWTHGSSEQRVRWFRTGLETGDMDRCNTFEAARL